MIITWILHAGGGLEGASIGLADATWRPLIMITIIITIILMIKIIKKISSISIIIIIITIMLIIIMIVLDWRLFGLLCFKLTDATWWPRRGHFIMVIITTVIIIMFIIIIMTISIVIVSSIRISGSSRLCRAACSCHSVVLLPSDTHRI